MFQINKNGGEILWQKKELNPTKYLKFHCKPMLTKKKQVNINLHSLCAKRTMETAHFRSDRASIEVITEKKIQQMANN